MTVHHTSRVRPGDRWDGVTLAVTRASIDWSSAVWTVRLRRHVRGPVVHTFAVTPVVDGETVTFSFHAAGTDTAKWDATITYYGEVVVLIPGGIGEEPTFGPYTIFTWSLEMANAVQPAPGSYALTWDQSAVTFAITLYEGANASSGGGGLVIPATADLQMHSSGRWYAYVAATGKFHRVQFTMVDGAISMTLDQTPLSGLA